MVRWEYKLVEIEQRQSKTTEAILCQFGEVGWKLHTIMKSEDGITAVMMRRLPRQPPFKPL